jgi:Transposase protein
LDRRLVDGLDVWSQPLMGSGNLAHSAAFPHCNLVASPDPDWLQEEFHRYPVKLPTGHLAQMRLSERGTCLSNRLWVRQIRKLTDRGHQTAILASDYQSDLTVLAVAMFARWSPEIIFKYAHQH